MGLTYQEGLKPGLSSASEPCCSGSRSLWTSSRQQPEALSTRELFHTTSSANKGNCQSTEFNHDNACGKGSMCACQAS